MDKNEKEEIIQEFLLIIEMSNIIKISVGDYEEKLTSILKRSSLIDKISANSIFDVLQSLEGLNAAQYNVSQKILKLISKIKIEEEKEKEDSKNSVNKSDEEKENVDNNQVENKYINNALDYLQKRFSEEGDEDE